MTTDPTTAGAIAAALTVLALVVWLVVRTPSRRETAAGGPPFDQLTPDQEQALAQGASAAARFGLTARDFARGGPLTSAVEGDIEQLADTGHVLPYHHLDECSVAARSPRARLTTIGTTVTTHRVAVDVAHRRAVHTGQRQCVHHEPDGRWYVHLAHPRWDR